MKVSEYSNMPWLNEMDINLWMWGIQSIYIKQD
jgi:hypothetical protein